MDHGTNWRQIRFFASLILLHRGAGYGLLTLTGETDIFLLASQGVAVFVTYPFFAAQPVRAPTWFATLVPDTVCAFDPDRCWHIGLDCPLGIHGRAYLVRQRVHHDDLLDIGRSGFCDDADPCLE